MTGKQQAIVVCGASGLLRNYGFIKAARSRALALIGLDENNAVRYIDVHRISQVTEDDGPGLLWETHEVVPDEAAAVLATLSECAQRFDVCGVLVLREDFVGVAALVADFFGLPSIGLRAAQVCRDKLLQRLYLPRWSPRFQVIAPGARDVPPAIGFPAVLKPTRRSGSSGVRLVHDEEALREQLAGYKPGETALLEEAVTGPEFSVEALVQDGKPLFTSVTEKRTNEAGGQYFVELGHTVPATSLSDASRQALLTANHDILQALDVRDGITHAEYRLHGGRPVLMEVNARLPGGSIPTLYRLATGSYLEEALMQIALGEPANYPQPRRYARQVYLDHPAGVLHDIHADAALGAEPLWLGEVVVRPEPPGASAPDEPASLRLLTVIKGRGDLLTPLRDGRDRVATFVIDAHSPAELDAFEQVALDGITIEVHPS